MKAAYCERFGGPVTIEQLPDPTPPKGGVVLEVAATGLCLSDWHGWMGHDPDIALPHVPGHELAGTIVGIGSSVSRWRLGDRVTLPFVCGCGKCPQCASGNHQICDHQFQPGFTHWGSFAQYVAIDYADVNLIRLPPDISAVAAASLGCRFVTSFRAIVDQGRVSAGEWVAVHGCGGVGLSAIMIANALGARVVAVDISEKKLTLAKTVGAVAAIDASATGDVVEAIRELTGGGAHLSVDALGSAATCFNSIACLRKRGRHVQVGLMTGDDRQPVIPMAQVIANELEILGSHGMQAHRYGDLLAMIRAGKLAPDQLVGAEAPLDAVPELLTTMDQFSSVGVNVIAMD